MAEASCPKPKSPVLWGLNYKWGGFVARDVGLAAKVTDDQQYVRQAVAGTVRRADLALCIELKEPQSETERKLAEIWREIFTIDVVGIADDFFELGGD